MEIDLNRGVTQRRHPRGFFISMYKDAPGHFFDPNANEVSEEEAAQAGFPVSDLRKERLVRERRAEAESRIRGELDRELERIESDGGRSESEESAASSPRPSGSEPPSISAETHEARHMGRGKYAVVEKATGQPVSELTKLTKEEAESAIAEGTRDAG